MDWWIRLIQAMARRRKVPGLKRWRRRRGRGPYWRDKWWLAATRAGRLYHRIAAKAFPYAEVILANGYRLDGWYPGEKIVSLKIHRFDFSTLERACQTVTDHARELKKKYSGGQKAAKTPDNVAKGIAGRTITGRPTLRYPRTPADPAMKRAVERCARNEGVDIEWAR